jgi:hypothetical protein
MSYFITTKLAGRTITDRHPLADPFVCHSVYVGWWDLLRALLRGRLIIRVDLEADDQTVFRVMNLHRMIFPMMRNPDQAEAARDVSPGALRDHS